MGCAAAIGGGGRPREARLGEGAEAPSLEATRGARGVPGWQGAKQVAGSQAAVPLAVG